MFDGLLGPSRARSGVFLFPARVGAFRSLFDGGGWPESRRGTSRRCDAWGSCTRRAWVRSGHHARIEPGDSCLLPTRWTDHTLPGNSSGVQYIITGMRGNVAGDPSQTLTVTFGVGSGGGMFIASSVTTPTAAGVGIKMAA